MEPEQPVEDATPGGASQAQAAGRSEGEAAAGDILIGADRAAGLVTLNRPAALNALTTAMRADIARAFPRWGRNPEIYAVVIASASERAFCAGGDLRELTGWGRNSRAEAVRSLAEEYALNWLLECFTKPTVSLIDGVVMGSGVGISLYGTHRVAGERYRFAMPETGIGLFPDVGVELGLRAHAGRHRHVSGADRPRHRPGRRLPARAGDALHPGRALRRDRAGLSRRRHGRSRCWTTGTRTPAPASWRRCGPPSRAASRRTRWRASSSACRPSSGAAATWAQGVVKDLAGRSPTSLKIAHRLVRLARDLDLRETLILDFRLACRCLEGQDLYEGVRAVLIDRDQAPKWQPARLRGRERGHGRGLFRPAGAGRTGAAEPRRDAGVRLLSGSPANRCQRAAARLALIAALTSKLS